MFLLILLSICGCGRELEPVGPKACGQGVDLEVSPSGLSLTGSGCVDLSLESTVHGEGELSVVLTEQDGAITPRITAGAGGGVFHALVLDGELVLEGEREPRLWRQGYQSWWWSGVSELEALAFEASGLPVVGGDGGGVSAIHETPATSWWVGLLGRPDGASVLLGALWATQTRFYVAYEEGHAWAVWGGRDEQISLAEGESLELDPLWVGASDDAFGLHRQYAKEAADHVGVAPREDAPPVGWSSWTVSYEDITEAEVLATVQAASDLDSSLAPLDLIQLDDGWQAAWGDWTANEKFPMGMELLAQTISEAGFTPGLWMAPFYVDPDTDIYRDHPDWWVKTQSGTELTYDSPGAPKYRVLDTTHPDAAAWLFTQVADRVADGWDYLKVDFLYAAAQAGVRHEDVTGMQAFHRGMEIIAEAAGDAWILACGAPMLPSLGYADSFRTGADIAFNFDPDPRLDYLRWQARATAGRSWQNGVWWWVDADSVLVREPFTLQHASGAVAANVLSGGAWFLGDHLPELDAERLSLVLHAEAVATGGALGQPRNPLEWPSGVDIGPVSEMAVPDDVVPPIWDLDSGEVVLLNLGEGSIEVEGPGGVEILSGETGEAGPRTLESGQGEIWRPGERRGAYLKV
ncbi:MAG: glycoside hydrolase family 36 protein [Myxococcota bacterium]|nr:glycoside hydrolase family 36 protein [Myxococcota bacterium]